MSCCALPPPSNEPRYEIPRELAALLPTWEALCPGISQRVMIEVGNGNMDNLQEGFAPPFTLQEATELALGCLEDELLNRERLRLLKEGSLSVRLGLAKPRPQLTRQQVSALQQIAHEAQHLLSGSTGALPPTQPLPLAAFRC